MKEVPVILLAFANDAPGERMYLRNLPQELNLLKQILEQAEDQGLCELHILPNARLDTLIQAFQRPRYRDRISILHYAGHAEQDALLLEHASGGIQSAHAEGLVPFLSGQKGLKLVFLNGCFSAPQAQALIQAGLPSVVGTVQAVHDQMATDLAAAFYRGLAQGTSIKNAWEEATAYLQAAHGTTQLQSYYRSSPMRDRLSAGNSPFFETRFPWEIYFRQGEEDVQHWNLPEAVNNPYFGLPAFSAHYPFPYEPFRFLDRYRKQDARIFFGRGKEIRDLYQRLTNPHSASLILFYGQSGVGKSSLLEAGLFPRLEESFELVYVRRDVERGLPSQLKEAKPAAGKIIILDQVEEIFTQPRPDETDELMQVLELIQSEYGLGDASKGKIILSYRKDYDSEIDKATRRLGLFREKIFLDKLDRDGIVEVILGLTSTEQLQSHYEVSIEDELPDMIANDLLADPGSPVSPILQIILTKLWKGEGEKAPKQFLSDSYQQLKRAGILLDDFFQEQMYQLRRWEKEIQQQIESSGLALDVLNFHTLDRTASKTRTLEELRIQYQHRASILDELVQKLQDLYLLSGPNAEQSSLAHDTLADVVHSHVWDSEKPGQRALRILSTKMVDYERQPTDTFIDEEDLALVEKGKNGMRIWTKKEEELIEKSRRRRLRLERYRRRNRNLKIAGVILITILMVIATSLWQLSRREAQVNALVSQAFSQSKTDATSAMHMLEEALDILPKDPTALQARFDLYRKNEFYHQEIISPGKENLLATCLTNQDASVLGITDHALYKWSIDGKLIDSTLFKQVIRQAVFADDGHSLLFLNQNNELFLFDLGSQSQTALKESDHQIVDIALSGNGSRILAAQVDGKLLMWDSKATLLHNIQSFEGGISCLATSFNGDRLAVGGEEGEFRLYNQGLEILMEQHFSSRVLTAAFSPVDGRMALGLRNGRVVSYSPDFQDMQTYFAHERRINELLFTPNGASLLSCGDDRKIQLLNQFGSPISIFQGHEDWVQDLHISADGQHFVSASSRKLLLWKVESKISHQWGAPEYAVQSLVVSEGGVLTGMGQQIATGDLNQISLDDDDFFASLENETSMPLLLWDQQGQQQQEYSGMKGNILVIGHDPDRVLAGNDNGDVQVWTSEGDPLHSWKAHENGVFSLFVEENGFLLTGGGDQQAILWDQDFSPRLTLSHPQLVSGVYQMRGSGEILTTCWDGKIRLWTKEGELKREQAITDGSIDAMAVSEDESFVVIGTGGLRSEVQVLDLNLNPHLSMPIENENRMGGKGIPSVAISADGRKIAAATQGGWVQVWNRDGQPIQLLERLDDLGAHTVQFSPDLRHIYVGGGDGQIRVVPLLDE